MAHTLIGNVWEYPPPRVPVTHTGTQGSLCAIMHACRNIMATTASVRFVPVSCFIYRSEKAKPTLGDVDINFCDLAKLPKPLSGCLSKKQLDEIRQWVQQYGKSVRQNTTRNFSTKDKPGTLLLNLYESAPRSNIQLTLTCFLIKTSPFNSKIPAQHVTLSSPSLRIF